MVWLCTSLYSNVWVGGCFKLGRSMLWHSVWISLLSSRNLLRSWPALLCTGTLQLVPPFSHGWKGRSGGSAQGCFFSFHRMSQRIHTNLCVSTWKASVLLRIASKSQSSDSNESRCFLKLKLQKVLNWGCTGDLVDLSALLAASFLSALQEVIVVQPWVDEMLELRGLAQDLLLNGGEIAADSCCFSWAGRKEEGVCLQIQSTLHFFPFGKLPVPPKVGNCMLQVAGGGVRLLAGPSGPVLCEGGQRNCFRALTNDPRSVAGLQPLLLSSF